MSSDIFLAFFEKSQGVCQKMQNFRSKCPKSLIHSKISDQNVQNLQYIPKFQIKMSKFANTFQNFWSKCPKFLIHSQISDQNNPNLQYIPNFQIKMSEISNTFHRHTDTQTHTDRHTHTQTHTDTHTQRENTHEFFFNVGSVTV